MALLQNDHPKFYTLWSLPQFLISVILACPESFLRSRTIRKDSRQAGMTLKTNIQFQTPCGLCRRVLHYEKEPFLLLTKEFISKNTPLHDGDNV